MNKIPPRPELFKVYRVIDLKDKEAWYNMYVIKRDILLWGFSFGGDDCTVTNTNLRYWDDNTLKDWEEAGEFSYKTEVVKDYKISNKVKEIMFDILFGKHKDSFFLKRE